MTLPDLIARLESASEGSDELDRMVAVYLHWNLADFNERLISWTTSVDDALTLVPDNRMWFIGHLDPGDMRFGCTITKQEYVGGVIWRSVHCSPAIAICIAALRAKGGEE